MTLTLAEPTDAPLRPSEVHTALVHVRNTLARLRATGGNTAGTLVYADHLIELYARH